MKQQSTEIRAAIYCRLSSEDGSGESNSITTQKVLLSQYCQQHNFPIVGVYVDDGWSGTNFDRPDFQRMLGDIEHGKVNMVLTKDLSRLGRDYLRTGYYTEIYFPEQQVRYIAVNDGVDTANGFNDITPFKNLLNDFYARDISRKIRSSRQARAKAGLYLSTLPPFGYLKDPADHHKLIVDEETAPTVRLIFGLAAQGKGTNGIARYLAANKIPCPGWWLHQRGQLHYAKYEGEHPEVPYHWHFPTIRDILNSGQYLGNLVALKTETIYKVHRTVERPKEDWVVVKNTWPALIDQQTWDAAHEKIQARHRPKKDGTISLFAGLVRCADCGHMLAGKGRQHIGHPNDRYYRCGYYNTYGTEYCTSHNIWESELYDIVLADIRECAGAVLSDEEAVLTALLQRNTKFGMTSHTSAEKEIKASEKRLFDLDRIFAKLYEDHALNAITDSNYEKMLSKCQQEQQQLQQKVKTLKERQEETEDSRNNAVQWLKLIRKYADLRELTPEILNELISKILVHQREVTPDGAKQVVEIYYRFIGKAGDGIVRCL